MYKKNCAIIKDISRSDAFYFVKNEFINKKIILSDCKPSRVKEYYKCHGKILNNKNDFCFHSVKLEFVNELECKKCKYRLQCITQGV